ncbi:hypothetical protein [Streptomyces sp. NPDC086519]|uniref:hypothetical protein n=1 Tax=Streptomyces sp. NPDC086519 TaxID=3154863 RepID=UPI00342D31E8
MGPAGLFCARSDSFGAMLGGRLVEGVGPCPPAVGVVGLVLLRIAVRQPSYGRTAVKEAV